MNAYLACPLINAWKVDLADESDLWRRVGVVRPTHDLEGVYPVLVHTLWRSYLSDCIPAIIGMHVNAREVVQEWYRSSWS